MKIALFNTMTPFVRGGAEILVDDLYEQLTIRGHQVTLFRIPFPDNYEVPLLETILSTQLLRFDEYDRVIAFKFPAFYAVHPRKVLWFFHQFRQVYELLGQEYGIAADSTGFALKNIIVHNDNQEIGNAYLTYTNAHEVTNRLKEYNDLESTVLPPPLKNWEEYYFSEIGDYIYYPSRITNLKRQHLAIEAMKYVKTDVKLVISGRCNEPEYYSKLEDIIKKNRLEHKVIMENKWIDDKEKMDIMAKSLGVMYIPYKEDSYGFVSMEGFYSSKPVIACTDSGGTDELIEDGVTGIIVEPTPEKIAEAMDRLFEDRGVTEKMGNAARKEIIRRNYTWDETIRRLLL